MFDHSWKLVRVDFVVQRLTGYLTREVFRILRAFKFCCFRKKRVVYEFIHNLIKFTQTEGENNPK